ncbi:TetR family transcriptional regulator [Natranaerovirga pectinivora]|uniref:TetR family transcriptional regulator n=1 Tax=Natranaerovirga pectinivora TaxID=682400 RepID=A0A4R3MLN2_9FIRM|nr:TetR/AcrR family transcriptional regulator C-terminal domain-containing protein [Natranaerovirga pectinivora]TCT15612.1 TetR family transcriptional regulator [Natranaerovirga pectinivora]
MGKDSDTTKKKLANALKILMGERPFEKIKIQDIVDLCDMNRRTFYYHFQDIYELLEWFYHEEALKQFEINSTYESWPKEVLYLFNYIESNKEITLCAFKSLGRAYLEDFMYKIVFRVVKNITYEMAEGLDVKEMQKDFLAHFYTVTLVGLITHWIQADCKENPVEITNMTKVIVKGTMVNALNQFAQND